jgi:N-acetylmuramic acid 6-phosphate etherase
MVDLIVSNDKLRDRGARIIATLTELEREDCFDLLDKANGEVKAALVMHLNGLNYSDAVKLLTQTNGNLDKALVS